MELRGVRLWKEDERSWCVGALQIQDQIRLGWVQLGSMVGQCGGEWLAWREVVGLQDVSRKVRVVAHGVLADVQGKSGCRGLGRVAPCDRCEQHKRFVGESC